MDTLTLMQIANQVIALISTILITSSNPKRRMYGFALLLVGAVPAVFILVWSELWVYLILTPVWLVIQAKGVANNYNVLDSA